VSGNFRWSFCETQWGCFYFCCQPR